MPENINNSLYLHAFNLLPQFGPARLGKVFEGFESTKEAFYASEIQLLKIGLESEIIKAFIEFKKTLDLEVEIAKLEKEKISLILKTDSGFPTLLKEIPKCPPLLYFKGSFGQDPDELCLAVVGTRKITNYGRSVTPQILEPIVASGITIVSGLAYGVDGLAHKISVDAGKRTIAVLGGGLDEKTLYPQNHIHLSEQILEKGGALISEHPPGTPCLRHHFIFRNRIISGLALGTLVIECGLKSGSLITATHALEQNRQVYAVPGPIYSEESKGPNNLLKMGAKPVTESMDILTDLNIQELPQEKQNQDLFEASTNEVIILKILTTDPKLFNDIVKETSLKAEEISAALTFLEMKGKIRNLGGQQYILNR